MLNKEYIREEITENSNPTGWNQIRNSPNGEVLAEWGMVNPYTGPSNAHDLTDGWVRHPNGYLKIRKVVRAGLTRVLLPDAPANTDPDDDSNHMLLEPEKYGVRYEVKPHYYASANGLLGFVYTRVIEFIENRDNYSMTHTYNQR